MRMTHGNTGARSGSEAGRANFVARLARDDERSLVAGSSASAGTTEWCRQLPEGARLSFKYPHGERAGQRREVTLKKVESSRKGDVLRVYDLGVGEARTYYACHVMEIEHLPPLPQMEIVSEPFWRPRASTRTQNGGRKEEPVVRRSCGDGRTADPAVQPEPSRSPGKRGSRLWDCLPLPGGGQESAGEAVASPDPPASAPAADSRGSSEPPVQYFSGSAMKEALLGALRRAESSIRATLYLIDDPEVCQLLAKKVREPEVTVELLLDAGQCNP